MDSTPLTFRPLHELAALLENGELSPLELTEAFLRRIEQVDGALKTYITVTAEQARRAARAASDHIREKGYPGLPHGIPYACKDMFQTRGIPTTGGSRVLAGWIPETDAGAVQRLNESGGILLGKLNQHEFAYGATGENLYYGTVPNPWDTTRLAGGSSSGSAAAVAAGIAAYALGTDTGGSTRAPAALCGVAGFKPTHGLISTKGVIPYCWSLDHVGIFTRTVLDAALIFTTLCREPEGAQPSIERMAGPFSPLTPGHLGELTIGIPRSFFFERVEPEILESVEGVIRLCETGKARLVDVDMPPMDHARTVSLLIQLPEMLSYHSRYLPEKKELYGEDIRSGMALGQFILAEHYIRAKRMVQKYRAAMADIFREVDLIITPACPVVAPEIGARCVTVGGEEEPVGNAITRFTSFFNLTGNPAISIPCGIHSSGLPMGIQLVGRRFREIALLKAAHVLESQLGDSNSLMKRNRDKLKEGFISTG